MTSSSSSSNSGYEDLRLNQAPGYSSARRPPESRSMFFRSPSSRSAVPFLSMLTSHLYKLPSIRDLLDVDESGKLLPTSALYSLSSLAAASVLFSESSRCASVIPQAWRAASMEFVATAAFVFSSICIIISCSQLSGSPMASISMLHFLVISFLILAVGASSGGHLNPCISLLYTAAQCAGGVAGSFIARAALPHESVTKFSLGGCMIRNSLHQGLTSFGAAFAAESTFTFMLIFVVATVALDPIRSQVAGPILAPLIIAASVGLLVFMSGGLALGYSGAAMNPARCIGPALVMGEAHLWEGHWIFWVAPYFATLIVTIAYNLVPPHHPEIYRSRKDALSKIRAALAVARTPVSA